jgi:hypothetical protein
MSPAKQNPFQRQILSPKPNKNCVRMRAIGLCQNLRLHQQLGVWWVATGISHPLIPIMVVSGAGPCMQRQPIFPGPRKCHAIPMSVANLFR